MKKTTRPSFLHRAFSALAALAILPAVAQAVNISVSNIYIDRKGTAAGTDAVFRNGETITFYVQTSPALGDTESEFNSGLKFKFRLKNDSEASSVRSASWAGTTTLSGNSDTLVFTYTVQSGDQSAANALYAVTGALFEAPDPNTIIAIVGDDVASVDNLSSVTWASANTALTDTAGSSRVSVNPVTPSDGSLVTTSIYVDPGIRNGVYRTDQTVVFYVKTDPVLMESTIRNGINGLNFRLRKVNGTKYARTAEFVDYDEEDGLIFQYTVQADDETPAGVLYPPSDGIVFSGSLTGLRTADNQPIRSNKVRTWSTPDTPLDDPVSFNPAANLTITGYEFNRHTTFYTDQTIGIFVKVEPMLDVDTLTQDFTFNFRFSEKDGIRSAIFRGSELFPGSDDEEALYFTYTVSDADYSDDYIYPADVEPLFGNQDYPFSSVRTVDGDKVNGLQLFKVPDPETPMATDIDVNPANKTYVAINFLDSDGNPFDSDSYFELLEGDRSIRYRVDIGRVPPADHPVTVTINWDSVGVFGTESETTVTLTSVTGSTLDGSIDRILDDGAVNDTAHCRSPGVYEYSIRAQRADDLEHSVSMKARVRNIEPEFVNLGPPDMVFGMANGTNEFYAVGAPIPCTVRFTDIVTTNDLPFTVTWTLGSDTITNATLTQNGNTWTSTSTAVLKLGENHVRVSISDKNGGTIYTNAVYVTKEGGMIYADPADPYYLGLANLGTGTIEIRQPGGGTVEWIPRDGTPLPQTDNPIANLRAHPATTNSYDSFFYRWYCESDRDKDSSDSTYTLREGSIPIIQDAKVSLLEDTNVKPIDRVWGNPSVRYLFSREKWRPDNFGDIDGDGLSDIWEINWLQGSANQIQKPNSDEVLQASESGAAVYDESGNLLYDFSGSGNLDADGLPANCFGAFKYTVASDITLDSDSRFDTYHPGFILRRGVYDVHAFRYPLDINTIKKFGYFPLGGYEAADGTRDEAENFRNSPYVDEEAKSKIDNTFINFDNLTEFRGIGEYEYFYDGVEEITRYRPVGDGDEPGTRPDKADSDRDGRPDGWEYYFWAVAYYNVNPNEWVRFDGAQPNGDTFKGSGAPISRDTILRAFSPTTKGDDVVDTDGDGLSDYEEYLRGTNPIHWDTDGDGMPDGWEVDNGIAEDGSVILNPLDPKDGGSSANPDGDWMAYYQDPETGREYRHFDVYERLDFDPRTAWRDPEVTSVSYAGNSFTGVSYANTVKFSNREEFDYGAWAVQHGILPYVSSDSNDNYHWDKVCPSPTNPDTDDDGIPDGWEAYVGIPDYAGSYFTSHNPCDARDGGRDAEREQGGSDHGNGDGLSNLQEFLCTGAVEQYDYIAANADWAAEVEAWPNKPWPTNPNISIGIGYADGCDTDGDQILDSYEKAPGCNPTCVDTDHDWLPDGWECSFATDPVIRDTFMDYDEDGLQNWQEYMAGAVWAWQYDKWYDLARLPDGFGPQGPGYGDVDMFDFLVSAGERDNFGSTYGGFGRRPHQWDIAFGARSRDLGMPQTSYPYFFLLAEPRSGIAPRLVPVAALAAHGLSDLGEPRESTGFNATLVDGAVELRWSYTQDAPNGGLLYATADPWDVDSDDDGLSDYYEAYHGLNPLYGGSMGGSQDRVGKTDDYFNSPNDYPSEPWDLVSYPWLVGDPDADPDKDGLSTREESAHFAVEGGNHHTDPSPLWITDTSYERSFVNLYYQPGRVMDDPLEPLWYFNSSGAPQYAFSFECNEGYDTDNDNIGDRSEVTIDELEAKADPLDFDNPRRRKALYLNGVDAAARTRSGYVVGNLDKVDFDTLNPDSAEFDAVLDSLDDLRTFTVEAWICPEEPVSGRVQTILERGAIVPQDTAKGDTSGKRLNFRLSITPAGALRGEFHNYQGAHVTLETDAATTGLRAGVWTHVAMTYSGRPSKTGTLDIYVNGVCRGSTPSSLQAFNGILPNDLGTYNSSSGGLMLEYRVNYIKCPIVIGASDAASDKTINGHVTYDNGSISSPDSGPVLQDFFKGWIDEVRIWDGPASAEAIRSRMYDRFDRHAVSANHYNPMDGISGEDVTIRCHYSFDSLPDVAPAAGRDPAAPIRPYDVESLPVGFEEVFTAPVDGSYPGIPWWDTATLHGYRYDTRHIPWIENTVAHMATATIKDEVRIKAVRDDSFGSVIGWRVDKHEPVVADGKVSEVRDYEGVSQDVATLPNSADPYGVTYTTVEYVANHSGSILDSGSYDPDEGKSLATDSHDAIDWSSDILPLGGAVADYDIELWDGLGIGYDIATVDSDGDGMPDWWEILHGLDPFDSSDAWEDFDRDGLDNLAEFLAGTSPIATDSDGDGYPDYYDRDTDKSLTYGELYDDGDGMPSWWEYQHGLNPRRDDGAEDPDGDGWSNYSEYLAGANPRQTSDYPVPPVVFNVWYAGGSTDGSALSGDLYVCAYGDSEMQGRPDAVYLQNLHPKDNGSLAVDQEWIGTVRDGQFEYSGQLAFADIDNSGTFQIQFFTDQYRYYINYTLSTAPKVSSNFNVASTYECKECGKTYNANEMQKSGSSVVACPQGHQRYVTKEDGTITENLIAYLPAGSSLSAAGANVTGTIDYLTGKWTVSIPTDVLPDLVGTSMIASYTADSPSPVFPFQMRRKFTRMQSGSHVHNGLYGDDSTGQWLISNGHLREGENRFFAFLDQNENALYDAGEPAGMAVYQPVDVGPGAVEVTIPLTDRLTGYPRFHWAPASAGKDGQAYGAEYFVSLYIGSTPLLSKHPVSSRPFFMENDVADTHGIILGQNTYLDWRWVVYTNANDTTEYATGTGWFDVGDNDTRRAFSILSPAEGSVESAPSFLASWAMDWRNEGVVVTLRNTDNNQTYVNSVIVNHPQRFGATYDNDYYFAIEPQKVLGEGKFIDLPDGHYTLTLAEYIQSSHVTKKSDSVNFIIDHTGATNPNPKVDSLGSISGTVTYYGKIPFTVTDEIVGTFDGNVTGLSGALKHTPVPGAVTVRVINGAATNVVATDAGALDGYTSWGLVSGNASVLDGSVTYGGSPAVSIQLDHAPPAGSQLVVSYKQYDCPIRIQAFSTSGAFQRDAATDSNRLDGNTTASFSGTPVAQTSIYSKGAFSLEGLPWGTYYLRAFIDQDQDRVLDSWESVGYAMTVVRSDYGMDNFQTIAPGARNVEIVIKDRDTDSDQLPDAWEYYYFGGIENQGGYSEKKAGVLLWQEYADGELDSNPLVEDTDGDGLPDVIEHQIGSSNHAWDSDGDGIGDLEEFLAGSDPTDASSKARFAAPAPGFDEDGTPVIVLQTPYLAAGTYLKYELLVKGSLADPEWISLGFSEEVGVDKKSPVGQPAGTVTISDPDGKGFDASFYKVKAHFGSDTLLNE